MFCKIKSFLATMGLKPSDIGISIKAAPIGIEDQKAVEQRKRIDAVFREQAHHLQSKALVAHADDCDDPVFCEKQPCFKWESDKIVAGSEKIIKCKLLPLTKWEPDKVETRGRKSRHAKYQEAKRDNPVEVAQVKKTALDMCFSKSPKKVVDLEAKKD